MYVKYMSLSKYATSEKGTKITCFGNSVNLNMNTSPRFAQICEKLKQWAKIDLLYDQERASKHDSCGNCISSFSYDSFRHMEYSITKTVSLLQSIDL